MQPSKKQEEFANTPGGILAWLKHGLMTQMGFTQRHLRSAIDRFVIVNFKLSKLKAHYTKANIYAEMNAREMTFRVFMKFLHILRPKKVIITVELITKRGSVFKISRDVNYVDSDGDDLLYEDFEGNDHDTKN